MLLSAIFYNNLEKFLDFRKKIIYDRLISELNFLDFSRNTIMADDKSEAFGLYLKYGNLPDLLAKELVRICLNKTRVVYYVFKLLNNYETLDISCRFLSKIS